jgi:hypothetical protein
VDKDNQCLEMINKKEMAERERKAACSKMRNEGMRKGEYIRGQPAKGEGKNQSQKKRPNDFEGYIIPTNRLVLPYTMRLHGWFCLPAVPNVLVLDLQGCRSPRPDQCLASSEMHAIVFVSVYTGLILLRRAPDHNRQDNVTLVSSLVFLSFSPRTPPMPCRRSS